MSKRSKRKEKTGTRQSPTGRGIRWYWSIAAAVVVVLFLLVSAILYLQASLKDAAAVEREARLVASGVAERVAVTTQARMQMLLGIAQDPQLADYFSTDNRAELDGYAEQLNRLLPGVLRLRLLAAGQREPENSAMPHLGYASLELIRLAEEQPGVPPAQVHKFGGAQQHIAIAVAVRNSKQGPALGVIHAAFPVALLQDVVERSRLNGRVEVRQLVQRAAPLVLAAGGSGRAAGEPDGRFEVDGTIWEVAYWSGQVSTPLLEQIYLLAPGGIAALLAVALMGLLALQMQRALKGDQYSLLELAEVLMAGKSPKRQQAKLLDMQSTLEIIEHQAREFANARKQRRERRKRGSASATEGIMVEEDIFAVPKTDQPGADRRARQAEALENADALAAVPASIFRAYDIRGLVGETLTENVAYTIGQAIGSEGYEQGFQSIVVARDGRNSSEALQEALINGLLSSGRDVIDIGMLPTPLLYYAVHELNVGCGCIVTGSHNPIEYNGIKVVLGEKSLSPEQIQGLYRRIADGRLMKGQGQRNIREITEDYIERVINDVRLARSLKVVVDCGNGVAGMVAPELFRRLGCDVVELFCEVDGSFPNHHPDPSRPENLEALKQAVVENQADVGLAFDGDGDRLGVIDSSGKLIWPDRVLMYLAIDVLARLPGGDIVYDVKCSRHLANVVLSNGGRPLMWKSGHSLLKAKLQETGALLAGEFSGHIMFAERWYGFDDALYAGARLLEILALEQLSSAEVFTGLPEGESTPEYQVQLEEGQGDKIMDALEQQPEIPGARMVWIDGLRAEFERGWGLVRASNTTPSLVFRFEADDAQALKVVQDVFRTLMQKVAPELEMPF
ncbi:phosphomannomutase/phosphoglucomutase [Candidatus Endoriftia persephone]|uniref:phosphomannomutase n=2 Tax=Gammaproteobacteria TaxID=1236 RepID=G2DBC5_9GAMM|nr:phosphomannomutase/phosphoglucomutase [Candidatus Endoriftia persephone]EGV52068.1 phosphomannomutase/phosphoglucomutase [endosymbiont of Riftia pachyptila (vent Ph05)]USF87243.1 phosphomannomutase/phosphoglucomutase [Candidatus Endoriftia persephone]